MTALAMIGAALFGAGSLMAVMFAFYVVYRGLSPETETPLPD